MWRSLTSGAPRSPEDGTRFGLAGGVTSVGMFGHAWGWAIPFAPLTVIVVGVAMAGDAMVARAFLPLTVAVHHPVIDGPPAARFVETLRELVESAEALDEPRQPVPQTAGRPSSD